MQPVSKLPSVGTTIFSVMSRLAAQHEAINLSQGFPNYSSDRRLIDLVTRHMQADHNQYAPMPGLPLLRQRIADKLQRSHDITVNPDEEINVTAGATQAIFTALSVLIHAGDEVITFEPAYDAYRPAIELFGGTPVIYQLEGPAFTIDWQEVGKLITPQTRMIIVNTPHNPTGTILSARDMEALQGIVAGSDIWVLSDEVYEHLIYDGATHESILRYPELRERGIATYSFGKTFHNTGWKIGYVVGPPAFLAEFRKVHQYNVFAVNTPMQYALADYLADAGTYEGLPAFYQRKRDLFTYLMADTALEPIPCRGTYFQCFEYGHLSDESDMDFASRLTKEYGVAAIPVSAFNASGRDDKLIRLCFAKTEEVLEEAGKRLGRL
jgi:methionine transaminase